MPGKRNLARERAEHALNQPARMAAIHAQLTSQLPAHDHLLGEPHWRGIIAELKELDFAVDFNQGLDARLLTHDVARELKDLRIPTIRLAYDHPKMGRFVKRAIENLVQAGISNHRKHRIVCYVLFNYRDTPLDLFVRIRELLEWGVAAYPMRYQPLSGPEAFQKDSYISPGWTMEELEMVAMSRRVIGFGGAFPPYEGLIKKFLTARSFTEAFQLRRHREREDINARWGQCFEQMGSEHQFTTAALHAAAAS